MLIFVLTLGKQISDMAKVILTEVFGNVKTQEFELIDAQRLLDFVKVNPPITWKLADSRWKMQDGIIVENTKTEDGKTK